MNNLPRQKLCELIANPKYGRTLCDNPQRCEGLLRDFCGQYRAEIFVLVTALKEGLAEELLKSSQISVPKEIILARLSKRLQDLGMANKFACWAVNSWALALGVNCQLEESGEETEFQRQELIKNEESESKLRQYEQEFLREVKLEYPLTAEAFNKLKDVRQSLGIKLVDIGQIEKPILLEKEAHYWKQSAAKQQGKLEELKTKIKQQQEEIEQKAEKFRSGLIARTLFFGSIVIGLGIFSYHQNQEIEQRERQISQVNRNNNKLEQKNNELEGKLGRIETAIEKEFEDQFGQVANGRKFWLRNRCHKPIKIAIRYKQTSGEWKTAGWWNISSYKNVYLADSGNERIRLSSPLFYYYAESQEGGSYLSGEESIYFSGRTLPMRIGILFPDSDDDYTLSLPCSE